MGRLATARSWTEVQAQREVAAMVVGAAANNDDEFGSELMAKAVHALKRKERARAKREQCMAATAQPLA